MLQPAQPTKEETLEQLERILQSRSLQGSESLRGFLRFVVTSVLENPGNQIKEYTIATEVFGRNGNYDPRIDSMVRVQAGRLRSKVQEYYASDGKADRVVIELPKGHYTPVFHYQNPNPEDPASRVQSSPSNEAVAAVSAQESAAADSALPSEGAAWLKWITVGLSIVCVQLLILVVSNYREIRSLKNALGAPPARGSEQEAVRVFWRDLLRSPEPVLVAFSNTRFLGTAEAGMKLLSPLDSLRQTAPVGGTTAITEHYTGVGEVMSVHFLAELLSKAGRSFRVKRSLLLTWDDLKSENFIFLGSPAENLLLRELPQEQELVFGMVKNSAGEDDWGIINLKPKPGEQTQYLAKQDGPSRSQISEDYALVSMLNGLDAKHRLLILAGITTYGTQAATEYVTKPEYLSALLSHFRSDEPSSDDSLPARFQVLLKVKVNGGVPVQISYVTHHVLR